MQRVTRSRTANEGKENSGPKRASKAGSKKGRGGLKSRKQSRTALGDISNNAPKGHERKKKRLSGAPSDMSCVRLNNQPPPGLSHPSEMARRAEHQALQALQQQQLQRLHQQQQQQQLQQQHAQHNICRPQDGSDDDMIAGIEEEEEEGFSDDFTNDDRLDLQGDRARERHGSGSSSNASAKSHRTLPRKRVATESEDLSAAIESPSDALHNVVNLSLKNKDDVVHEVDHKSDPYRVCYAMDIMSVYRRIECRRLAPPNYMMHQRDINKKMRTILIDWLVEVHFKFRLQPETLFLTVNVIDRFLSTRMLHRSKLQLLGCTAMFISAKYEEMWAPEIKEFVDISDDACTRDEILEMETIVLSDLAFNLTLPSPLCFALRFSQVAAVDSDTALMIEFLLELTLQEYSFIKYRPSMTASAATSLALQINGMSRWTATLRHHTRYTEADILPCVRALYKVLLSKDTEYRAVRKKYSSSRFFRVARNPVPTLAHLLPVGT